MIGLVDIGGTKLLVGVTGADGALTGTLRHSARVERPMELVFKMLDELRADSPLEAVSIAAIGPFERVHGTLITLPGMPMDWHQGWRDVRLVDEFQKRFNCPVFVENDANCAAVAEALLGAGKGAETVVYYTISTGVGGGVVRNGRLDIGRDDLEMGHQILWPGALGGPPCPCGAHGCLEALVGGESLAKRYGRPPEEIDDPAVWEEVGRWLGLAVVNTTALIDPDVVVFGGGVCHRWEEMRPTLEATVASELRLRPAPDTRPAALGEDRGLLGALLLVPERIRGGYLGEGEALVQ